MKATTRKAPGRKTADRRKSDAELAILGQAAMRQIGPRLTTQQIAGLLRGLGSPYSKFSIGAPHVTLSAQVPWVEDRGYLEIINPRTVYPSAPNANFLAPPYGGNIDGEIGVWLLGLDVGGSYFLQFRVGVGTAAVWKIRSSQGLPFDIKTSGGPYHTLPVLLPEVDGSMELVRLEAPGTDWIFYDVEVSLLT